MNSTRKKGILLGKVKKFIEYLNWIKNVKGVYEDVAQVCEETAFKMKRRRKKNTIQLSVNYPKVSLYIYFCLVSSELWKIISWGHIFAKP
jgi:N-glycosylase/DNA lyase